MNSWYPRRRLLQIQQEALAGKKCVFGKTNVRGVCEIEFETIEEAGQEHKV